MSKPASRAAAPRSDKGAKQSRASLRDRFDSYLANHRAVARDSLQRLLRNPLSSLMTWLAIGIALSLPGVLFVSLDNVDTLSRDWDGAAQISLFVHRTVADPDARQLAGEIGRRGDVDAVEFLSREQALAEFQAMGGYGEVLSHLADNPLPAVIVVRPRAQAADEVAELHRQLAAMPQIERAVLDLEWVQRLHSMMALARQLTTALALLLAAGVLLVIGNTIRLAIESRRDEIVIVKLVGGTNAFVRRPFLYTGLWYGLGGALLAWVILLLCLWLLAGPVAELAGLYASEFRLSGLGFGDTLLLWLAGALLGLLGAWLAVGRHLSAIEPR